MSSPRYTLLVLMAILAVNHLDRHVLSINLDAIGREFILSDTQLGLLSGLVFAIVYVLFGFPVAKLAARGNRRNIIAAAAAIWSSMTIAMAAAQSFLHLILARLGVGIGEAGCVSPAHSMISDLYPEERRTSAMATFVVGANIGVLLAFLIGGIVGQQFGWRWAFVAAGVPGLILAAVMWFTVAEPQRDSSSTRASENRSLLLATLKHIWADRGLRHAMFGLAIVGIVTFGALAWNPAFIIRQHSLNQAQTGIFLALTIGIGGGLCTWLSGKLADRLGARDPGWRMMIVVLAIVLAKPFVVGFLLLDNTTAALACFVVSASVASVFWGPTFAMLHSRVPNHMRPMATSIFLFVFNLIGVGVGPTLIGFLSDTLFAQAGSRSLSYALVLVQIAGIWAAWHYWQAKKDLGHKSDPVGISPVSNTAR